MVIGRWGFRHALFVYTLNDQPELSSGHRKIVYILAETLRLFKKKNLWLLPNAHSGFCFDVWKYLGWIEGMST